MAKACGIGLALLALLALVIAIGMLCHGFIARAQMKRCQRIQEGIAPRRISTRET